MEPNGTIQMELPISYLLTMWKEVQSDFRWWTWRRFCST